MRTFTKLVATTAVAASAMALTVAPAMADPPRGITPRQSAIVGVGSNTIQNLMNQLSVDYNKAHRTGSRLYTWDAVDPRTGLDNNIATKGTCATIMRPNGSGAGVAALILNAKTKDGNFCIDYARSSSPRSSSNPPDAKGGVVFVALAKDAVTYATNTGSNAPTHLTIAQLARIYNCTATTWNQVGGTSHAKIDAQLPQTSSGTRKFFLASIGVTAPGSCVDHGKGESPNFLPEENEGTNKFLQGANVIYPFSIGAYIAERFHSTGPAKNIFGKDIHGHMQLRAIKLPNGVITNPTVGSGAKTTINPKFDAILVRTLYDVVRWAATKDNIPRYLEPIFASAHNRGWICSSKRAQQDVLNYGFLNTPFCGHGS
jgi:ABC-type phosphate transport system substrate-binding protein